MRRLVAAHVFAVAIAAGLWGCRELEVQDGFPCSTAGHCPAPYQCGSDRLCRRTPFDGGAGAGGAAGNAGGAGGGGGAAGGIAGASGRGGSVQGGSGGSAGQGGSAGSAGQSGRGGTSGIGGAAGAAGTAGAGGRGGAAGSGVAGSGGTTGIAGAGGTGIAGAGGTGVAGAGGTGVAGAGGTGVAGAGGTGGSSVRYALSISLNVVLVNPPGGGSPKPGPVTSVPTGIACGGAFISGTGSNGDCTENYTSGTSVVLTAQGTTVVNFTAWTGDCSGTNPVITVVMDRVRNCLATFTEINN